MNQYHNYVHSLVKIHCPDDFVTERVIILHVNTHKFHEELKSLQNVGFYVPI